MVPIVLISGIAVAACLIRALAQLRSLLMGIKLVKLDLIKMCSEANLCDEELLGFIIDFHV